jgi:redox-sensing transcriptional repressor
MSDMVDRRRIPEATVARLPVYQRLLAEMAAARQVTVSSEGLAEVAGVNAAMVRKDLSYLGSYGTRGAGYDVEFLLHQIERELGVDRDWPVVIVGLGNLGTALANSGGFASRGFRVAALVDNDPHRVGQVVAGVTVRDMGALTELVSSRCLAIAVITTPAAAAQDVADRLVAAGIASILNFSPAVLNVPDGVVVRQVDLSTELLVLSFHEGHRQLGPAVAELPAPVA